MSGKAWLECLISNKYLSFLGIHGEPGIKRSKVIPVQSVTVNFTKVVALCILLFSLFVLFTYLQVSSADEVVRTMINHMTNPDSQSHLPIKSGALIIYINIIITCPFFILTVCI